MLCWPSLLYEPDQFLNGLLEGECPDDTLMQFTGLLDKDGNEIYEDDVFEMTDGDDWVIGTHRAMMDGETLSIDQRCIGKILGNIHENPELLA